MRRAVSKVKGYFSSRKLSVSRDEGFTLMELLIAVVISSLVVSGLLYLVIELLRVDNRETALEEVQRDSRRAIDYIADELKEAVYVYTNPADVTNSITGVGNALAGQTPIIAFWKASPISQVPSDCRTSFPGDITKENACNALQIRRASYDLVVYSQIFNASGPWKGKSRISRYVLKQYKNSLLLEESDGYVDPGLTTSSFESWERDMTDPLPSANSAVLVDYIAGAGSSSDNVDCADLIPGSSGEYTISPPDALEDSSFFACVRDNTDLGTIGASETTRTNQDVYLFLKGDVSARSSAVAPASEASRSPMLQTQVLIRGVLNKSPAN